ncbi:MAG: Tm-1-like ATP-binding domain-containing protein [Planctomycetota bacterium]
MSDMASTKKTIALLGAFDTKGVEYAFVKDCIERAGHATLTIDFGVLDTAHFTPDVTREDVANAGGANLAELVSVRDRGTAVAAMAKGAAVILPKLYEAQRFDGVLALGGGSSTSIACKAMRALPVGVPKVMVSTLAGSDSSQFVGSKDIVMIPSIVDIAGINRVSRGVLARAAGAVCGMVATVVPPGNDKPVIVASMFGNTTPAVEHARKILEQNGYEVIIFHCTGNGGKSMESLVESGQIAGVLDITTTEWADELVGGVLSAGPGRLDAAAKTGVPAIVCPGCLDMVNFWKPDSIPHQHSDRKFYPHNPDVTLMRTNIFENQKLGEIIAAKLNQSTAPVTVLLPLKGVSMVDAPGGKFWWPEADAALFEALKKNLRPDIRVIEMDCNINDTAFSDRCAMELMNNILIASEK